MIPKRIILYVLPAIMAITILVNTRPLAAQEGEPGVAVQQLRLQIMPEFDDPRVLVIAQGRLDAGAEELPRPVTFRLPRGAQINQMATLDVADGSTQPRPYDTAPDPADPRWIQVTYTLDSAHFFYEFYYDPLAAGRERAFAYVYSALQPVRDLQVEVQEPLRSTSFTTDPAAAQTRTDTVHGFTYHQFSAGSLAAGESWSAGVTYAKPDQEPSLSRAAVQAMQNGRPASVSTTALATAPAAHSRALPAGAASWLSAGVAAALFVVGAFVVRSRWPAGREDRPETGHMPANYCAQCGAAAVAVARFCSACGNRLDA